MPKYYLPPTVEDEESPDSSSDDSVPISDCGTNPMCDDTTTRDQFSRTPSSSTISSTAEHSQYLVGEKTSQGVRAASRNTIDIESWNRILELHEEYRQGHSRPPRHPISAPATPVAERRSSEGIYEPQNSFPKTSPSKDIEKYSHHSPQKT